MNTELKYVPVFRGRREECFVLRTFPFGNQIYPYLEIIREFVTNPRESDINSKAGKKKRTKTFECEYLEVIGAIKATKVFVDIPVHINLSNKKLPAETIEFLSKTSAGHGVKTGLFNKLLPFASRIIPVVSSYSRITGELGSVSAQEKELRKNYSNIAFRCNSLNALSDLPEFLKVAKDVDYVFVDWEEVELDITDNDQKEIVELLGTFQCTVIVHRNSFPLNLTNARIKHGEIVKEIDNGLIKIYKTFGGSCMSDYVGIKKDFGDGGMPSPGFFYYDAVDNDFYGFRYAHGGHKKGEIKPHVEEFETTIIPAVISSEATRRMSESVMNYLSSENEGWQIIKNIELGEENGGESGKLAAKFKRIGMLHYLSCMKTKIISGLI